MITMTTEDDPMVVRELDETLPLAMRPTPSGARLDLRLYFHTEEHGTPAWLSMAVIGPDGRQVGKSLPIDKPEGIGPYFGLLAAKAYEVAAAKRTRPPRR
jgi:hypothetical protein